MAIWSLVLYGDVKKTKCKKLTNILLCYGIGTLGQVVVSLLTACMRRGREPNDNEDHEHKEKDSFFALLAFVNMCFGFAIVTDNPPAWWGEGATNPDRCDPSGDVWPAMETVFITAFALNMAALCCCCMAVCTMAAQE